jgi:cyanophycinase-like exopeptidase
MAGPVALVGGGEFLPSLADFDHGLLAATGRRRPRVAILPTAAYAAGEAAFLRAAAEAEEYFRGLGAEVETVAVRDRATADEPAHAQAIGEADVIVLCGGAASWLRTVLQGSATWSAAVASHERGAILVGCGGAATALGARQLDIGLRAGMPVRWADALAAAPRMTVVAGYDARPEPVRALVALLAPGDLPLVGIDRDTAVVGRDGSWEVHGHGRVTVWRGRHRERHHPGEAFRLDAGEPDAGSARI